MKTKLVVVGVFLAFFGLGNLVGTPVAQCRACNSKTCFHDSDCGRSCSCMFLEGKKYKAGQCVQVGG